MDQRLVDIYVNWQVRLDEDEWYFAKAFEAITNGLSAEEAFNYIPNAVRMILLLQDDFLIWNTLYFLIRLYSIIR
ncbi:hypothetical protein SAMN05443246_1158 [Paenibacillus sp. GP183]|jgi:hypothetical protein|nr:hypothetical protein SAMN05443246_1158 [Paenibacillus sp. GP183]